MSELPVSTLPNKETGCIDGFSVIMGVTATVGVVDTGFEASVDVGLPAGTSIMDMGLVLGNNGTANGVKICIWTWFWTGSGGGWTVTV